MDVHHIVDTCYHNTASFYHQVKLGCVWFAAILRWKEESNCDRNLCSKRKEVVLYDPGGVERSYDGQV